MGKLLFRYGTIGAAKLAHLLMTRFNFEENERIVKHINQQ